MGINAMSSAVSSSVATAAKPVASQSVVSVNSANLQTVTSGKKSSAEEIVVKSAEGKEEASANENDTSKQLSEHEIAKVTDEINAFMESMNTDIQFVLHSKTKELMVQVQEGKNHKILKEFPAHELLDAVARMREYAGLLVDKKA